MRVSGSSPSSDVVNSLVIQTLNMQVEDLCRVVTGKYSNDDAVESK